MKNFRIWVVLLVAVAIVSSCSEGKKSDISHLPFRNSQDSQWGMVSTDGKILFEGQFANMPSVAVNGIFVVKNSNGYFEYFKVGENPRKFGGEYLQAGLFHENAAPVVLPESAVSFIDTAGNTLFVLKEFEGSKIVSASNFNDGMAFVENSSGLKGYINPAGEFVFKPQFDIANNFNAGLAIVGKKSSDGIIYSVINKLGETTATLDSRIKAIHGTISESLVGYTFSGNMDEWGFMDISGNIVIPADSTKRAVKPFHGKYAIYSDGKLWGAVNRKGEVVINPIYASLEYGPEGKFIAGDGEKFNLIDLKLKRSGVENFAAFTGYINGYNFVGEAGRFVSVDKSGKQKGETTYFEVLFPAEVTIFESDVFSVASVVRKAISVIAPDRIGIVDFGLSAENASSLLGYPSAELAKGAGRLSKSFEFNNIKSTVFAELSDNPVVEITEKQMSRDMWGKAYYEDVVTGYIFNEESTVKGISYTLSLSGELKGREEAVMSALKSMAKASGYKTASESANENSFISDTGTSLRISNKSGVIEIKGSR